MIGDAVNQLIEMIDDTVVNDLRFRIEYIKITKEHDSWAVRAYNSNDKSFKYAVYVNADGQIIADGA